MIGIIRDSFQIINNDRRAFEQEMLSQKRVTEVITDKHNEGRDPQSVPIPKSIPNNEPEKGEYFVHFILSEFKSLQISRMCVKFPFKPLSLSEFEHWCFHCVSPLKHMSSDMRKTIRQFLRLRRTSYPQVATDECTNAKNFSRLHKQTCRHPYCTTISLVDHNQGNSVRRENMSALLLFDS
ncbi:unnamed protein product [Haemonchus placei]|uniref:Uncharacterized protein n=1 Tax=Haemonchus placei TaxID=6290 RepID=A0A0N4WGS4_HAEPC|nr:unnamed protein product [Haemonchus placei]